MVGSSVLTLVRTITACMDHRYCCCCCKRAAVDLRYNRHIALQLSKPSSQNHNQHCEFTKCTFVCGASSSERSMSDAVLSLALGFSVSVNAIGASFGFNPPLRCGVTSGSNTGLAERE